MSLAVTRGWSRRVVVLSLLALVAASGALRSSDGQQLEIGGDWDAAYAAAETFSIDDGSQGGFLAIFAGEAGDELAGALPQLEREVEALPAIEELVTPLDLPGIETLDGAKEHPVASRVMALERGLLLPIVLSADRYEPLWVEQTLEVARRVVREAAPGADVGLSGKDLILAAQDEAYASERLLFLVLGTLLGFTIASVAFRRMRATFLAGLPPIVGVGLALGTAKLVGLGTSGLTQLILPLLVLTIGFTDSLHVVVAAIRARRRGARSAGDAADEATAELLGPCALTSLTTAIGFGSLATSGSAIAVDFGLTCALATVLSFAAVFLVLPLLCRTPLGARLEEVPIGDEENSPAGTASVIARVLQGVLAWPRAVSVGAIGLTAACALIAAQLDTDRRVTNDLADGDPAAETLARVDEELGGILPLHVRVDWAEGVSGDEVLRVCSLVSEVLERDPSVTGAVGPAELVASTGLGWPGLALLPARWRGPFLNVRERSALIHARIPDGGSRAMQRTFEHLATDLDLIGADGVSVSLVGEHFAYLRTVSRVTVELARSLAIAAVLILATLAIAFRSWRIGLASVVPNLLPIGASAAALHLAGRSIDLSSLVALTLSLGIATDDTIHVLSRWERSIDEGLEPRAAARRAVLLSYPALAVTTITLGSTFAILLTSSLPAIRDFGTVASITLFSAFLADIWLLPALLVVLHRRQPAQGEPS